MELSVLQSLSLINGGSNDPSFVRRRRELLEVLARRRDSEDPDGTSPRDRTTVGVHLCGTEPPNEDDDATTTESDSDADPSEETGMDSLRVLAQETIEDAERQARQSLHLFVAAAARAGEPPPVSRQPSAEARRREVERIVEGARNGRCVSRPGEPPRKRRRRTNSRTDSVITTFISVPAVNTKQRVVLL